MAYSIMPSLAAAAAVLSLGTVLGGCYAEATTGATVTAEYEPAHIEVYPHEYYDGHVVYLVGDRWYYRDGPRWVYYVREPQVLVERRVVYRRAPRTVRESTVVHEAPPAERRPRAPRERRVEHYREPRTN